MLTRALYGCASAGLRYVVLVFQKMMKVDVRSMPIDVPKQEIITKDNVTVGVDAVVYLRVIDSAKAMLELTNYIYAMKSVCSGGTSRRQVMSI